MGQVSRRAKGQEGPRVKMGQESRWAKNQDGLLWLKSAVKTNWTKRSQLGLGSSWTWPKESIWVGTYP